MTVFLFIAVILLITICILKTLKSVFYQTMNKYIIFVFFNFLLLASTVYLASITLSLTSHQPIGTSFRLYVLIMEHIYIFSIVLYYLLNGSLECISLALFLTFGCFLQFGATEMYLATMHDASGNFNDQLQIKKSFSSSLEILIYIKVYFFINLFFGLASLVEIVICTWICVVEEGQTLRREEILKSLEDNIIQVTRSQGECSICLLKYQIGEKCYSLCCGHCFHKECFENWLKEKFNCPLCRNKIGEGEERG